MENTTKSRFQKGTSGNPAGRKPGKTTGAKLRAELAKELTDILATLVQAARGGDVAAAKLVLDRCLPALRPIDLPEPVALTGDTLSEQGRAILASVAAGDIAVATGGQLIAALAGLAKIHAVSELQSRIEKLEAAK